MYCPRCGKAFAESDAFCTACGEPNPEHSVSKSVVEPAPKINKFFTKFIAQINRISQRWGIQDPVITATIIGTIVTIGIGICISVAVGGNSVPSAAQKKSSVGNDLQTLSVSAIASTPTPTLKPTPTATPFNPSDFVGKYEGDDPDWDCLYISLHDSMLYFECGAYRGGYVAEEGVDINSITGNSVTFTVYEFMIATPFSATLTFIPASESPYGFDTIKMESATHNMEYVRTSYENTPLETYEPAITNNEYEDVEFWFGQYYMVSPDYMDKFLTIEGIDGKIHLRCESEETIFIDQYFDIQDFQNEKISFIAQWNDIYTYDREASLLYNGTSSNGTITVVVLTLSREGTTATTTYGFAKENNIGTSYSDNQNYTPSQSHKSGDDNYYYEDWWNYNNYEYATNDWNNDGYSSDFEAALGDGMRDIWEAYYGVDPDLILGW